MLTLRNQAKTALSLDWQVWQVWSSQSESRSDSEMEWMCVCVWVECGFVCDEVLRVLSQPPKHAMCFSFILRPLECLTSHTNPPASMNTHTHKHTFTHTMHTHTHTHNKNTSKPILNIFYRDSEEAVTNCSKSLASFSVCPASNNRSAALRGGTEGQRCGRRDQTCLPPEQKK